jgi:hypothetical protein
MDLSEQERRVESGSIGQIGVGCIVELNLVAASSQSRRNELRKLSRMSFCSRKENENEHGEPRFHGPEPPGLAT